MQFFLAEREGRCLSSNEWMDKHAHKQEHSDFILQAGTMWVTQTADMNQLVQKHNMLH